MQIYYLFNVMFFPSLQIKETGEVAVAGGYVDLVPALDKSSTREPLKVGGSNRNLNLHSIIVRIYFCEEHGKNT